VLPEALKSPGTVSARAKTHVAGQSMETLAERVRKMTSASAAKARMFTFKWSNVRPSRFNPIRAGTASQSSRFVDLLPDL